MGQKKAGWRIKNRVQASYEFDSNIRENPSDSLETLGDSSFKLIFDSRASRVSTKSILRFSYQGGLQTYLNHSVENKFINGASAYGAFKIDKVAVGLRLNGRLKIYLNDVADYAGGQAEIFFQLPNIYTLATEVSATRAGTEYENFPSFNYSENLLALKLSKRVTSGMKMSLEFAKGWVDYDRLAIAESDGQTTVFLEEKQNDKSWNIDVHFNYTKSFLVDVGYSFQQNTSNSSSFDYYRHQIIALAGISLPYRIWLRGYGGLQLKDYMQEDIPVFPTDIDPERQKSNFFVLDLSREVTKSTTALLRLSYYNNESIIRSRFYSKVIISGGFDVRL